MMDELKRKLDVLQAERDAAIARIGELEASKEVWIRLGAESALPMMRDELAAKDEELRKLHARDEGWARQVERLEVKVKELEGLKRDEEAIDAHHERRERALRDDITDLMKRLATSEEVRAKHATRIRHLETDAKAHDEERKKFIIANAELAQEHMRLRALLDLEWPCGWPEPQVIEEKGHGSTNVVEWEPLTGSVLKLTDHNSLLDPEEVKALGAGLIRIAVKAEKG